MFIAFEGIEGSAKSTQLKLLDNWLGVKHSIPTLCTGEPGSKLSKECQSIRKLLLDPDNDMDDRAELFLYLADRAQHVGKIVIPALKEGKWVLTDRYDLSTYAYQGHARGYRNVDDDWFARSLMLAKYNKLPDKVFILDLDPEIGLERAKASNKEFKGGDRIEKEAMDFHKKVREGFLEAASVFSNCVIINAERSREEIHEDIKAYLLEDIQSWRKTNGLYEG